MVSRTMNNKKIVVCRECVRGKKPDTFTGLEFGVGDCLFMIAIGAFIAKMFGEGLYNKAKGSFT